MASIFDKQNAFEKARAEFWHERQTQAYQRSQDSTPEDKASREQYFAEKLSEPKDVTMTLSQSTATLLINAMIDKYEEYRHTMPADAVTYYSRVMAELRREHEELFPVYDNS